MRRRTMLCALLSACLLSACDPGQLQFRGDHRLSFQSPEERAKVQVPVTIRWTIRDFDLVGLDGSRSRDRGVFAVFVDRAPLPAGEGLKWLVKGDRGCERDPRCPGADDLRTRNVYLTTSPELTLDVLPKAAEGVGDEQHFVNVVLLDGTGHRIGEAAWYLPFRSERRSGR